MLKIQLLGRFHITYKDAPLSGLKSARLQALLAYLLLHRSAPQSRQHLAYLFWPDSTDSQARTNLRYTLHQLRSSLPESAAFLHIDNQNIQWNSDAPYTLDIVEFERALAAAKCAADSNAARRGFEQALAFYQGELFPNCYEEWIFPERTHWQQMYVSTLTALITLLENQQDYKSAVEYAQVLLQHDPLLESTYARLMQLHAAAGDRAAALRVYQTCKTKMAQELGVAPGPTIRNLYERLRDLETSTAKKIAPSAKSPLIGREQAWGQIQASWQKTVQGQPQLISVLGEAGIGKTRLVEELASWASLQGIQVASASCYALNGRLAYAPLQTWLRAAEFQPATQHLKETWLNEIARLIPDILPESAAPPSLGPLTEAWQQQRLFEALARYILYRDAPLILILDDAQWCDEDTLAWLYYLLHFNPQTPLLIVATIREGELEANQALADLLRQLRRTDKVIEIQLLRFNMQHSAALTAQVTGQPVDDLTATQIYTETEGNPLFIVEMARSKLGDQHVAINQTTETTSPFSPLDDRPLPPKIQVVIEARLAQLSPSTYELAGIAAVIGRAFTFDILQQISEEDEATLVDSLDELWQRQIIREVAQAHPGYKEAYDFSHDKVREVIYLGASPMRRRMLHRQVARAMESQLSGPLDTSSSQIAAHYEYAGSIDLAIAWYTRAGEAAQQIFALQEAIANFQQALALLALLPASTEQETPECRLQMALGSLFLAVKGYAAQEVERAFSRAWALSKSTTDLGQRFRILWGLGRFYHVKPDLNTGLEIGQQLLALAHEAEDSGLLLEAYCSLGTCYFHLADLPEARAAFEQSQQLYDIQVHGDHGPLYGQDPGVVGLAYGAWTLWCLGYLDQAQTQVQAALALAETLDHPYSRVVAMTYATVQYQFLDDHENCLRQAETVMALTSQHGFTLWQSMATFLYGWALARQGDIAQGLSRMQESIALFQQTGAELGAAYFAGLFAKTLADAGQADFGLAMMTEAFNLMTRSQDRWCEAELHRLKGEMLASHSTPADTQLVETCFQTAITVAQTQQARWWELRATVSLCQLWHKQGRTSEAHQTLEKIVGCFSEGTDLPPLKEANRLIATWA